ncbi:MAG: mannonate dehydratase [FCB group bacterium]|nr:mannonate dehydratase [FCB group bacterium]
MYPSFRWFGKEDPVSLEYIRQIPGVKDIVGSLFELPVGEIWSIQAIQELKDTVDASGLNLSVIESCLAV